MPLITSRFHPDQPLPLVVHPDPAGGSLVELVDGHRAEIDAALVEHGAILFRGFGVDAPDRMAEAAATLCESTFEDNGEHAHDAVAKNVYTPVEYTSTAKLLWHTENSFNHRWPSRLLFASALPAQSGGQTPLVDTRRLWRELDPALRDRFATVGVTYVRSYGVGVGLDWQQIFRTEDPSVVEQYCQENHFQWEWLPGGGLRTRSHRPAVIRHPVSGEPAWFMQAAHWHPAFMDPATREAMVELFGEDDLPRNCFLGDDEVISDETMAALAKAYQKLEVSFDWQRGDLLLVDNVSVAHARQPYTGPRKLLVSLGDMMSFDQVETLATA